MSFARLCSRQTVALRLLGYEGMCSRQGEGSGVLRYGPSRYTISLTLKLSSFQSRSHESSILWRFELATRVSFFNFSKVEPVDRSLLPSVRIATLRPASHTIMAVSDCYIS